MARVSFEEFSAGLPVSRQSSTTEPGQSVRRRGTEEGMWDGTQGRLAEVGNDVSSTISQALAGEGQFAGKSPVERGVSATAAGFSTVPRGAVALAPTPIRKGVEWIGDKFSQGLGKITGAIGNTKFMREAVGQVYTDPNTGASTFIPNDLGVLEPALNVATDAGEIAGTITGANPRALFRGDRTPEPRMSGTIPVQQFDVQPQPVQITNGIQKSEEILSQFGEPPTLSSVGATMQGIGQQVGDFARRTVTEAQDVARRNQELSALPEPEANIRRAVADDRVIDLVNTMTPEELLVTQRLVDQAKLKQRDITPNTQHPKVIAGEELLKPVDYIITTRKQVGADLGELRKQLDATKNINTNSAFRNFHQYLKSNYSVQFDTQGNIIPGAGTLARSDVPEIQKLYDELRGKTITSQRDIDQFLQRSLKDFDLRQAREQTFSDDVPRIAEQARRDMRQLMPEQYNALSTQYAQLSKPLTDMVKLLGYKGDLDALTAKDLKAGEVGMRILGNAADRPQSVIDDVVNTASANGYSSNVNLNNIITIADQLESLYDITPSRSLQGQVSGAIEGSNAIGAMGDAATMNIGGLYNRAMQSRASQQEIRDAFDAYIQYRAKPNSSGQTANAITTTTLTPEQSSGLQDLGERLRGSSVNDTPEYLRDNPQAGFFRLPLSRSIASDVTPAKVAGLLDDRTFDAVSVVIDDIPAARLDPAFNRFLRDMRLDKASDDEINVFLKEVTNEYENLNPPTPSR